MKRRSVKIATASVVGIAALTATFASPAYAASPLCSISAHLDNSYEWMTSVTLADVTFEPLVDQNSYYDESTHNPPLAPIALTPGHSYSASIVVEALPEDDQGNTWTENAAIWIDYNGNGTLDANEKISLGSSDTSKWPAIDGSDPNSDISHTFTGTFTVPSSAASGTLWARAMNFDSDSASAVPCLPNGASVAGSAVDFQVVTPAALPDTGMDRSGIEVSGLLAGGIAILGAGLLVCSRLIRRRRSAQ